MGDGRKIKVSTFQLLSHKPVFSGVDRPTMLVSELINEDTRQWDRTKIFQLFAPRTRREILAIPLNLQHTVDAFTWKENRANRFSVKSSYHVALHLIQHDDGEHSAARLDGSIWKRVWSLNIPPKVRSFIWRAYSNILPTRENLHRRRVKVEPRCELCCQQPESTSHLLWECPFARNVWALSRGKIQKCSNAVQDFFLLFSSDDGQAFHA